MPKNVKWTKLIIKLPSKQIPTQPNDQKPIEPAASKNQSIGQSLTVKALVAGFFFLKIYLEGWLVYLVKCFLIGLASKIFLGSFSFVLWIC